MLHSDSVSKNLLQMQLSSPPPQIPSRSVMALASVLLLCHGTLEQISHLLFIKMVKLVWLLLKELVQVRSRLQLWLTVASTICIQLILLEHGSLLGIREQGNEDGNTFRLLLKISVLS